MTDVKKSVTEPTRALVAKLCAEASARHGEGDAELVEIEKELRRDLGELSWDRSVKYKKQPYTSGASAFFPAPPKGPKPAAARPQAVSNFVPTQAGKQEKTPAAEEPKTEAPPPPPPPPVTAASEGDEPAKNKAVLGKLIFQGSVELNGELHLVSINELPSGGHVVSCIDLDKNSEVTMKVSLEDTSTARLKCILQQLRLTDDVLSLATASDDKEDAVPEKEKKATAESKPDAAPKEEELVVAVRPFKSVIAELNPADLGGGEDIPGIPGLATAKDEAEIVKDKVLTNMLSLASSGQLEEVMISSLNPSRPSTSGK